MKVAKKLIPVFVILAVLACSDDGPMKGDNDETFKGILEMDIFCNVIGGDTTDFQPRPEPGNYSLIGACPNPIIGDAAVIKFKIPQADSVWIFVFDKPNSPPIGMLFNHQIPEGVYEIMWNNTGPMGIYRVEMYAASGFTSYGDVQFVPDK